MSEARDPTQADFDLERVMDMFDTALTSRDERVQNALRQLLTIVALTSTQEDGRMAIESSYGPLRQMQEDINNLSRSLQRLREDFHIMQRKMTAPSSPYPSAPVGPWGQNPNAPYTLTGGYGPASYSSQVEIELNNTVK